MRCGCRMSELRVRGVLEALRRRFLRLGLCEYFYFYFCFFAFFFSGSQDRFVFIC